MNTTASVEVLVAEVRVLMVGSRQVTLSVFAQLDEVPFGECEPFGRVHPREGGNWVVGRTAAGVLVKAQFDWERPRILPDEEVERNRLLVRCESGMYPVEPQELERLAELERLVAAMPVWQAEWSAARRLFNSLPLIVLAGLR